MEKFVKRAVILAGVFLAAVGICLVVSWTHTESAETVYTLMEEPSLPVVYTEMYGSEKNRLTGYRQEMQAAVSRDSLTILPEDRQLPVTVEEYGSAPLSVRYEIRSMDGERLVERTDLDTWESAGGESHMVLPIQNLLTQGTEYLLHIRLETELHGQVHYYTRILWPENDYAREMMELAREFSVKTLDEAEAASLTLYMESSSTADNSSLGDVTLKSSFSQLTWAGLEMEPEGEPQVTLRELQGIMGQVQVTYRLSRQPEDGETEHYEVEDYYTLRWDARRIYMMDMKRTTRQIFSGSRGLFSGKRILLGIGTDDAVVREKSESGRYLAFVFNRDLWLYDQTDCDASKIFSFRSASDTSGRSSYDRHGIRIVSVSDDGDVDFMVYGYMNRGVHEGCQGLSFCHYDDGRRGVIQERFFVPSDKSFDELQRDVETLCRKSSGDMFYFFFDQAVYRIDLTSGEYMAVVKDLNEGSYAVNAEGSCLAWQDGPAQVGGGAIHLLDLESGSMQEISAPEGSLLRVLGFVQGDLVYGLADEGITWMHTGRLEEAPMYALEIVNTDLEVQSRYEPAGMYIAGVTVDEARVHMNRLLKRSVDTFEYRDEDTIVCNTTGDEEYMAGIGWYASEPRRKLYFIQLDKEVNAVRGVRLSSAQRISCDESQQLDLRSERQQEELRFYAYGRGRLAGVYPELAQAAEAVYDLMGFVTDQYQDILWDRINRASVKTLSDPQTLAYEITRRLEEFTQDMRTDGLVLLDGRGLNLRKTLYYIGQGWPVLAYRAEGEYVLLYSYDQYNVTFLDPVTGERTRMGQQDATAYFESLGNDFVCCLRVRG